MNTTPVRPLVLCFGGHDPSGGAGIQADIESLAASGCHALPIVTALTEQDTRQVYHFEPVAPSLVQAQVSRVITDMVPDAIKVGMVANQQNLAPILEVVRCYPLVPLVVDPVLAAGFGGSLSSASLAGQLMTQLIPLATVVTPNSEELTRLAAIPDSQPAVKNLLATGCKSLLVTGTHA
ncbi:MAG: hydroxymethylpyrimidine/phosphomethylpyrimidine kinase, partial [Gammaproteobacteria bacterium]